MTTPPHTANERSYADLGRLGVEPLWRYYRNLFPAEPHSLAVPFLWRYHELRPHLLHFAQALSLEEAERRVLMLVNPGMQDPPATVNSLYAGIQVVTPGETAQAHRHSAGAFRFVIEGEGAYTTVDGARLRMRPGDLLLTPGWSWHDHRHEGTGPMMWLDALDYPLVNALEAGFFETYDQRSQDIRAPRDLPASQYVHGRLVPAWDTERATASLVGNHTWEETRRAFDAIAHDAVGSDVDGIVLEYTDPWSGGPVMPTLSCRIQRLPPGFRGAARRRTPGTIHHVVSGRGTALVDGRTLDWRDKDVFAVPGWAWCELTNTSRTEDAFVFSYSNEPVLRALGLYRETLTERMG
ncbi:gentisate 1,2-dioxygenase [Embleya hyalina]|uniref:Gentisate 1,2-dioxygenase n=2 Tax=Embleya hyalina TaxID=516124 RepID=A0A401YQX2_9ACTN|nr:gentisate 1,2-dioxygenase [Embleya hyalina]